MPVSLSAARSIRLSPLIDSLLFSFSLSLSPSLPLCGAVAYRLEAIHPFSRKTGLSLSFSFSLSIFLFPSRPVPGTHHRVSSFHPIARMGSREFLVLHCSFPSLGRNRRCSNSRTRETPFLFSLSLSFLLFFNLECFTRFYEDLGSLSYHRAFMPLSESRNF